MKLWHKAGETRNLFNGFSSTREKFDRFFNHREWEEENALKHDSSCGTTF